MPDAPFPLPPGVDIVTDRVALPWSGGELVIARPAEIDPLLDAVKHDPEQNLPYWAEVWPSGIALADLIAREPSLVAGLPALEIGCGLGTTASAALRAGADLLAADYYPDALAACRANCLVNAGREPATLAFNWRDPGAAPVRPGGWPLILAADVLYEKRDVEPLLSFVNRLLAADGLLLLAEPGRASAAVWLNAVRLLGWRVECETHEGPWPDPKDKSETVRVHRVRRG